MSTLLGIRLRTSNTESKSPSRIMTAFRIASISSSLCGIMSIIPEARLNVDFLSSVLSSQVPSNAALPICKLDMMSVNGQKAYL